MSDEKRSVCAWCYYARDRKDICEIYCTGGFVNEDGHCDHFLDWDEYKRNRRKKNRGEKVGRST